MVSSSSMVTPRSRTLSTGWELTTWADFQLCLHRLLMSTGCKCIHNGFLDVSRSNGGLSISGWIGQLSCLTIFSTSLSVAAFLCRAGCSMLESTGSHGRGVERRVPVLLVLTTDYSDWLVQVTQLIDNWQWRSLLSFDDCVITGFVW